MKEQLDLSDQFTYVKWMKSIQQMGKEELVDMMGDLLIHYLRLDRLVRDDYKRIVDEMFENETK